MTDHLPRHQIDPSDLEWYETGHINTTRIIARLAGLPDWHGKQIAIYCQMPDYFKFTYSAGTPLWAWVGGRGEDAPLISKILHGFHGEGPQTVQYRQQFFARELRKLVSEGAPEWKLGFTAHALGDAYAHTWVDDTGQRHAYGYPLGHGLDFICGVKPDHISQHPELYLDYCRALFWALCGEEAWDSVEFAGFEGGFRAVLNHPQFTKGSGAAQEEIISSFIVSTSRDDTTHAQMKAAYDALPYSDVIALLTAFSNALSQPATDVQLRHRPT
jgi:hypothetical protein